MLRGLRWLLLHSGPSCCSPALAGPLGSTPFGLHFLDREPSQVAAAFRCSRLRKPFLPAEAEFRVPFLPLQVRLTIGSIPSRRFRGAIFDVDLLEQILTFRNTTGVNVFSFWLVLAIEQPGIA